MKHLAMLLPAQDFGLNDEGIRSFLTGPIAIIAYIVLGLLALVAVGKKGDVGKAGNIAVGAFIAGLLIFGGVALGQMGGDVASSITSGG